MYLKLPIIKKYNENLKLIKQFKEEKRKSERGKKNHKNISLSFFSWAEESFENKISEYTTKINELEKENEALIAEVVASGVKESDIESFSKPVNREFIEHLQTKLKTKSDHSPTEASSSKLRKREVSEVTLVEEDLNGMASYYEFANHQEERRREPEISSLKSEIDACQTKLKSFEDTERKILDLQNYFLFTECWNIDNYLTEIINKPTAGLSSSYWLTSWEILTEKLDNLNWLTASAKELQTNIKEKKKKLKLAKRLSDHYRQKHLKQELSYLQSYIKDYQEHIQEALDKLIMHEISWTLHQINLGEDAEFSLSTERTKIFAAQTDEEKQELKVASLKKIYHYYFDLLSKQKNDPKETEVEKFLTFLRANYDKNNTLRGVCEARAGIIKDILGEDWLARITSHSKGKEKEGTGSASKTIPDKKCRNYEWIEGIWKKLKCCSNKVSSEKANYCPDCGCRVCDYENEKQAITTEQGEKVCSELCKVKAEREFLVEALKKQKGVNYETENKELKKRLAETEAKNAELAEELKKKKTLVETLRKAEEDRNRYERSWQETKGENETFKKDNARKGRKIGRLEAKIKELEGESRTPSTDLTDNSAWTGYLNRIPNPFNHVKKYSTEYMATGWGLYAIFNNVKITDLQEELNLATANLNQTQRTINQLESQKGSLTLYTGTNEKGQPIFTNQTHSYVGTNLDNPATDFLQNFEKEVLNQKGKEYNITGDIDDYLVDSASSEVVQETVEKAIAKNNQEWKEKDLVERSEARVNITNAEAERDLWEKKFFETEDKLEDLKNQPPTTITEKEISTTTSPTTITLTIPTTLTEKEIQTNTETFSTTETKTITNPTTVKERETTTKTNTEFNTVTTTETEIETATRIETKTQTVSPSNLPLDWKSKLDNIPKLKRKIRSLNSTLTELEKERDNRPPVSLIEYQQLLKDKEKAEKDLNQTRTNFNNYKNTTNLTLTEKENKINELTTKLENEDLRLNKDIAQLNTTIEELEKETKKTIKDLEIKYDNSLREQKKSLNSAEEELRDYERTITVQENEIAELEGERNQLETERDNRIEEQARKIKELETKLTEQQQTTDNRDTQWERALGVGGLTLLGAEYFREKDKEGLETEKTQVENERDNYQNQVNQLQIQINNLNNYRCLDCPLVHLDNHECKKCNLTHCSEEYHKKLVKDTELQIVNKIITELDLNTDKDRENVLEAVITEIKDKITPPRDEITERDQKINKLEEKINYLQSDILQQKPQQSFIDEVIELSKELNVMDDKELEEFKNTATYQELLNKYNSLLKNELNSKQKNISNEIQSKKDAQKLNWVLGGLTIGGLLVILGMMVRSCKKKRE